MIKNQVEEEISDFPEINSHEVMGYIAFLEDRRKNGWLIWATVISALIGGISGSILTIFFGQ
jgi:hypothetical protein